MPIAATSTRELIANRKLNRVVIDQRRKFTHAVILLPFFQYVAHAPHVVDQLAAVRIIDLCTQAANSDIDYIRIAVEVDVPNLLCYQRARQNLACAPHEQQQQVEFLGGQVDALTAAAYPVPRQIDLEVRHAQDVRLTRRPTPQYRAHP